MSEIPAMLEAVRRVARKEERDYIVELLISNLNRQESIRDEVWLWGYAGAIAAIQNMGGNDE